MAHKEAVIEKVTGRGALRSGQDVKIVSGETENIDFRGMRGRVIRDEEVRDNGASGKRENMVMVRPYLSDGRLGTPFDLPRKRLKGPRDGSGLSRFVGKVVGVIRGGKYIDLSKPAPTPANIPMDDTQV